MPPAPGALPPGDGGERLRSVQCLGAGVAPPDLQLQAELLRQHQHLTVGPLRDPVTGKFVALRAPMLRLVG